MADFFTDLNRHIADYENAEHLDEIERAMTDENSEWAVFGEAATMLPADAFADPEEPVFIIAPDGRFLIIPGMNGETKGCP